MGYLYQPKYINKEQFIMKRTFMKFFAIIGGIVLLSANSFTASASELETYAASPTVAQSNLDSILSSYYSGQSSRAYTMIQKSIFKRMVDNWTPANIVNPTWNYETFTQYQISGSTRQDLYVCTFSANNNKHGYIVVAYDGSSLEKFAVVETPYLYDLKANMNEITTKLSKTDINLSSTVASRVRLNGSEVILFTDNTGKKYACYLDSFKIVKI